MNERRQYRNPPIKEAFCEFHFGPRQDWDPIIPGKLHRELGDRYSGKARERRSVSIGLETHEDRSPDIKYREDATKVQLVTEDNTRIVGIGQDVLSIHMMHPYQDPDDPESAGWEDFFRRIKEALSAYWELVRPAGVQQIGIRYINEILVPKKEIRIDGYIKDALPRGAGIPNTVNGFACSIEYRYDDDVRLALTQATLKPPPEHMKILLDLYVVWKSNELISQDEALAKAEDLRNRERTAFEAFITDESRNLFDAE